MKMKEILCVLIVVTISPLFLTVTSGMDVASSSVTVKQSMAYSPETIFDLGYTGKGVNIAIIDSGIDDEHPDLNGVFVAGVDFSIEGNIGSSKDGTDNPDDINGHGTSVAGCIFITVTR